MQAQLPASLWINLCESGVVGGCMRWRRGLLKVWWGCRIRQAGLQIASCASLPCSPFSTDHTAGLAQAANDSATEGTWWAGRELMPASPALRLLQLCRCPSLQLQQQLAECALPCATALLQARAEQCRAAGPHRHRWAAVDGGG